MIFEKKTRVTRKIFIVIFFSHVIAENSQSDPTVELPLGKIEGSTKINEKGNQFYVFEGIPYAKPPIEENRFKEPLPAEPWKGTWQAKTVFKCLQFRHLTRPYVEHPIVGTEDCLYLNIYTPSLDQNARLNVIVFIHGGAFMFNFGAFHGPDMLLNNNVVYVNLNYRLGPLGFLSTEDDVVPGNNGIKDQIIALEWIRDYIKYFGGNPQSVTIAGNSAGGASVHLHYLTTKSKGLFHRGISQSGTALNSWVLMEDGLEKAKKIAVQLKCPINETDMMIECLKKRPGREIVQAVELFQPWLYNPYSPFAVAVDTWASDPLLTDHPYQILKKKLVYDVPWLVSHVGSEGLYPAAEFYANETYLHDIDKNWEGIVPHILHYNDTIDSKSINEVSSTIRNYYFGNRAVSRETYGELVQMIGDRLFVVDIRRSVKLHTAAICSHTYFYYFTYRGQSSRSDLRSKSKINFGAAHGDDASYILQMKINTRSTEKDRAMSDLLVGMWLSFAETGKPNISSVEWTPVSKKSDKINYLRIESPEQLIENSENLGQTQFWNSLPFRENEKLFGKAKEEL